MHKLITILTSNPGGFAAEQQGQSFGLVAILYGVTALILAIVFARARLWKWEVIPVLMLLAGGFFLFANQGTVYRMQITPGDALEYDVLDRGKVVSHSNIHLENIASADLEFRRQDRRMVVLLRDGKPIYPLGDDWVSGEPDQYVVLTAVRQAIGQGAAVAPAQAH